jgi:uncharacterized membrane protein
MKKTTLTGAAIAAAVAMAFVGNTARAADNSAGSQPLVKCIGGNSCKGKSECAAGASGCKGQNSCKGKGYIMTPDAASCIKAGGKPQAPKPTAS